MADYFDRGTPTRQHGGGYRALAFGGCLLLIAAAGGWLWLRQPVKDALLPSGEPVADAVSAAPQAQPLPAQAVSPPTSPDLAAVGDSRAAPR